MPKFFTHYLTKPPCPLKQIQQKQPPAWLAHEMHRRGVTETNLQSGVPCSMHHDEEVATMKNAIKGMPMRAGLLASGAMLAMFAFGPYAHATPVQMVQIGFNGAGGSGHASLTVGPDATPGDPTGAWVISDASGTFSDSNLGIDVLITGVYARNWATPNDVVPSAPDGLPFPPVPFPASYSALVVLNPPGQDTAITFDDLYYPDGSPRTCWDYPFSGGFLDPYGVMFTLSNGGFLDLWSDGFMSPGGLTYGFAVMLPNSDPQGNWVSDFQFSGVRAAVPEPNFLWLFGAGVLGLFAWRRSAELRKASRTD